MHNGAPANRAELERYGLSEEIISYKRRWFVVLEDAPAVLPTLLAQRRPTRDTIADSAGGAITPTDAGGQSRAATSQCDG